MTIEKAMQRIGWRLSGKPFQPNQNDIDAYNFIVEFVEQKQKQQIIDNQLFGKLYIYLFGEFVNYYKATVIDDIPQKQLNKLLSKDLKQIVQEVTDRLNFSELENYVKKKDLKGYKPMEYEEVAENMRVMVNGALNTFNKKAS